MAELREDVVVAGGRLILFDDAHEIDGERPQVVDAAAHAVPVAAPGTLLAAEGLVVRDAAVVDGGARRGLNGQAAPQPVAAVATLAAVASLGDVVGQRAIAD